MSAAEVSVLSCPKIEVVVDRPTNSIPVLHNARPVFPYTNLPLVSKVCLYDIGAMLSPLGATASARKVDIQLKIDLGPEQELLLRVIEQVMENMRHPDERLTVKVPCFSPGKTLASN